MSVTQYHKFQDPRGNNYIIRDIDLPIDTLPYYEYITNHHVTDIMDIPRYTSLEDVRHDLYNFSKFTSSEGKCFAVSNAKDNKLIGTLGYNYVSDSIAELVVDLNPYYWNLGIMQIAFGWLFAYTRKLRIQKLLATVKPNNKRLLNGLKRFDFHLETINSQDRLIYSKIIC